MSNFRSRALLDLCYEFDCLLQIPGICTGGTGEPCHANWPEHGKGMGMKAHDVYAVPGCRSCHMALDQGSKLSGEQRKDIWHRAFWKYLAMLWNRGLLRVSLRDTTEAKPLSDERRTSAVSAAAKRKRGSQCVRPSKRVQRPAGGFA